MVGGMSVAPIAAQPGSGQESWTSVMAALAPNAAIGMFVVGGALSVWEGVNALIHPPGLDDFWVGVGVLVIALLLDGASRAVASRGLRIQAEQRGVGVRQLLAET